MIMDIPGVMIVKSHIDEQSPQYHYVQEVIVGFLDAVLVSDYYPCRSLSVTVKSIELDEVSSTRAAFRKAGKDAGNKFMKLAKLN